MAKYLMPQIKIGGPRHSDIVDFVIVDDKWLDTFNKYSSAYRYKGQGWGAYFHPLLQWTQERENLLRQACVLHDTDSEKARSAMWVDENELLAKVGYSKETYTNGLAKEIVVADQWDLAKLIKSVSKDGPCPYKTAIDRAAWLSGIASIQAGGGGDYLTGATYAADLGTSTADVYGRYDSSVTETALVAINHDNGTYITGLKMGGTYHNGIPTTGYKITCSNTSIRHYYLSADGTGGSVDIDGLNTISTTDITMFEVTATTNAKDVTIRNCLIDMDSGDNDVIKWNDTVASGKIYNNKIWDWSGAQYALFMQNTPSVIIENNTLYTANTQYACRGNTGVVYRNNIAITTAGNTWLNLGATDGYNNYSSGSTGEDGDFSTGSGNITSGTTAVFQSTDDTSSDFLKPVAASDVDGNATTPTLWSTDIAGNPYNGTIGAHQIVAAGGFNPLFFGVLF